MVVNPKIRGLPLYHHYHRRSVKEKTNNLKKTGSGNGQKRKMAIRNKKKIIKNLMQRQQIKPSAIESEILPLHKPTVYSKGISPSGGSQCERR